MYQRGDTFRVFVLGIVCSIVASSFVMGIEVANFSVVGPSDYQFNRNENTTFNITVGATGNANITSVQFSFQVSGGTNDVDVFVGGSNGTSATTVLFANSTTGTVTLTHNLSYTNTTVVPLVPNGTTRSFWFTIQGRQGRGELGGLLSLTVNATNHSSNSNTTTFSFIPTFTFDGYVRNDTGCGTCWQNGTNVTLYAVTAGSNSPDTLTALASNLSNMSGYFVFGKVNASSSYTGYKLKTVFYNASGSATKVGNIMPYFPAFMFYGGGFDSEFDMSLKGSTFYLQPAATINISATNGTTQVPFGYQLVDQALGFPVDMDVYTKRTNFDLVVPANRAYVVSFFRIPQMGNQGFLEHTSCGASDVMNSTTCPAPPKTVAIEATTATPGAHIVINQSLIVRKARVTGCLQISGNMSALNITAIRVKMLPWASSAGSFVSPLDANDGTLNLSSDINYTRANCQLGQYNLSVLNNTGYLFEFYAKNASLNDSQDAGAVPMFAAFQNLTALDDGKQLNITLQRLVGAYYNHSTSGTGANASSVRIRVLNETGEAVTTNVNANIKVKNTLSGTGTIYYIVSAFSSGIIYLPILNNSNYAKVMVFSQNGPPREVSINLSSPETNITLASMSERKGFKKFHANGTMADMNTSSTPIQMRFLSTGGVCELPNAPDSCTITAMNASNFNPMKVMLAGKVNMEIKITSTNVTLIFHEYDMMSAKQPPMESTMNENATGRSTTAGSRAVSETWNFGSFAPTDSYKNVTIVMPYSDTSSASNYINDSDPVNVSIPVFYNEQNTVSWNRSAGGTEHTLPEDFIGYNTSYYRELINSSFGATCNSTDPARVAFINTTANFVAMTVPHFSTLGATVSGSGTLASSGSSSTTSSSSSSSSGGGGADDTPGRYWTNTFRDDDQPFELKQTITRALKHKERIQVMIANQTHHVGITTLTTQSVGINVSSTPQYALIMKGESHKFDVTDDAYYDLEVRVDAIADNRANLTLRSIHEAMPLTAQPSRTEGSTQETENAAGALADAQKTKSLTSSSILLIIGLFLLLAVGAWWFMYTRSPRGRVLIRSGGTIPVR